MSKKELCAAIEALQNQFLTLDWTYHESPVGTPSEKMYRWPGNPEDKILICVHKSNGIQELFHRHDFSISIIPIWESMIPSATNMIIV